LHPQFHRKINFPKHAHPRMALIGLLNFTLKALLIFLIFLESKFGARDFWKITRASELSQMRRAHRIQKLYVYKSRSRRVTNWVHLLQQRGNLCTRLVGYFTPGRQARREYSPLLHHCALGRSSRKSHRKKRKKIASCIEYFSTIRFPASDCKRKCWLHLI